MKDYALSCSFLVRSLLGRSSISRWFHKMSWDVRPRLFSGGDYTVLLEPLGSFICESVWTCIFFWDA